MQLFQAGRLEQALPLAQRAVETAQVCSPEHALLASVLRGLERTEEAEAVLDNAVTLGPGTADAYDGLAFVAQSLGQHSRAHTLYLRATELAPSEARFQYNLACSERSLGNLEAAAVACDRAIAIDAAQYPSYLLRSELRVQTDEANHIEELRSRLGDQDVGHRARMFLGYALAKELDDVGRHDEAFTWFADAAAARRCRLNYDVGIDEAKLARIREVYGRLPAIDRGRPNHGIDSSPYIFIVGLPRSGTTLVERILMGLEGVRSNGETDHFSRALLASASGEGDVFQRAAAGDPAAVAQRYARLAMVGAPARRIIEKLPLNYLYIGAIRRALPEATILLVRRSAPDSCFAMYRTLFASGYPFSYDLRELGRYYAAYEQLIGHWSEAFPDSLHEVRYDELVREPLRIGAGCARASGLDWDDAAIDIQKNRSVSLTASAAQVRRPIYASSSGHWRHYERHLGVLLKTLREHGVNGSSAWD